MRRVSSRPVDGAFGWVAPGPAQTIVRPLRTLDGPSASAADADGPDSGPPPDLVELGQAIRADLSPVPAGRRAAEWAHEMLRYERGATHVRTSSAQARVAGGGVRQDFAHVTLALLRAIGLPARYVSGYLHPAAGAWVGDTTAGESHAWVEFWAGEWIPVDPTSLAEVADRHALLARGRDYADVRPLSGIYSGPAAEQFGVSAEVTRLGLIRRHRRCGGW